MTKYSIISKKYLFIFLLALIFASKAVALEGTVITKTGDKYENVKYKIDNIFKVVIVYLELDKKNISFPDIKAIYDAEGNNIAGALLKDYYKPEGGEKQPEAVDTISPEQPVIIDSVKQIDSVVQKNHVFNNEWRSKEDKVYKEAEKKLWNVGIRLGGNFSIPVGTYYEGINSDIGFEGDFLLAVTHNIAIRMIVSKAGLNWEDDFRLYSIDPEYEIIDQEFSLKVIRYMLAVQYYNRFDKKTPGKTIWYAVTGLGAIVHKSTYDGKLRNTGTDEIIPMKNEYSETKFVMNLGVGIIQLFSKNIGLDFGLNWDLVYIGTNENEDYNWNYYGNIQTAGILDFKLSLIALF